MNGHVRNMIPSVLPMSKSHMHPSPLVDRQRGQTTRERREWERGRMRRFNSLGKLAERTACGQIPAHWSCPSTTQHTPPSTSFDSASRASHPHKVRHRSNDTSGLAPVHRPVSGRLAERTALAISTREHARSAQSQSNAAGAVRPLVKQTLAIEWRRAASESRAPFANVRRQAARCRPAPCPPVLPRRSRRGHQARRYRPAACCG